jgi:exodeoxyribonuclease-5
MALTDTGFQERLNNIKDAEGISMWTKIKEAILDILNALGLDVQPGSALAYAIKDSMDLIQANQEELKKNLIETKEFIEFGTKYRFEVNSEGNVTKAEFAQGNYTVFKPMNKANAQKKYDNLKENKALEVTPGVAPTPVAAQPSVSSTGKKTYSGKVTSLQPNQIFVFGSNPEGRHGAGAAKYAKDNFGAVYGQGEGLQGQSYALPTKDLRVKENNGLRSISPEDIIKNIQTLYEVAKQNPDKEFLISDYSGTNLNGYTADEMADMFIGAGYDVRLDESGEAYEGFYVPTNIIHNENFQKIIDSKGAISKEATSDFKKYEIFPGVFTNQGQTAAIDKMTNFLVGQDKTFLLKGRGGTGKTTIVKMVMDKSNIPHSKILGATVSDEARGILADNLPSTIKTKTIASALGLVPDFNSKTGELYFRERNIQEQKDFDARGKSDAIENAELIIIDEASMVGEDIYDILMRKKRPSAKVIFMGDNAQIPPIMPDGSSKDSPVFKLLEGTKTFAELTQRMRQGEESPILPVTDVYAENIENMQRGEQGKENPITSRISNFDPNTNSGVIFTNNRQEIVDGFVADFQNNPDNLKNAVIIGARNEVVDNFAQLVRNKLFDNPSEPFVIGDIIRVNSPFVQGKEVLYANGFKGKVIAVESSGIDPLLNLEKFFITVEYDSTDNSGITSRKTTRMTTISPQDKKSLKSMLQALAVKAKNKQIPWQTYYQIKESIVDLGYNYAMTSHKVQGSTYQNVYILEEDIMSFPGGRLQRNRMIYTAVSRPTTKLVVYSSKSTPITKKGLDMGVFTEAGINPEALSQKPAEDTYYGEENTFRSEEKNTDYYDDYEAYRRMKNSEDDMIEESPLNSDAIRNYLLICGK